MDEKRQFIEAVESDPAVRVLLEAADRAYESSIDKMAADMGLARPVVSSLMDQAMAMSRDVLWYGECPGFRVRVTDEGPVLEGESGETPG